MVIIRNDLNEGSALMNIPTSGDIIYQKIHDAIMENQLRPNYRLQEEKLAKTFNVSRTIIREALQRLSGDSMIYIEKNKGATVYQPSVKESKEIFYTRRLLETSAIEQIIKNITNIQLDNLSEICQAEQDCLNRNRSKESIKLSAKFHIFLISIADNEVVTNLLTGLIARTSLIISAYASPMDTGCSCGTHAELLDILKKKDIEASISWLNEHFKKIEGGLNLSNAWNVQKDLNEFFTSK